MINTVLQVLLLLFVSVLIWFSKDLPNLFRELRLENEKNKNQVDLQRESFFRQISGSDLNKVFNDWTSLIADMDQQVGKITGSKGDRIFIDMQQKALMYGSVTTVEILSAMMQHIYDNNSLEKRVNIEMSAPKKPDYSLMIYLAYLVSSLKFDFTGYKVKPEIILKIKIKDLESEKNKEFFELSLENVKKDLMKNKIDY